jgi:hypothetical protein
MYSILVLFVQEEFSQIDAGGYDHRTGAEGIPVARFLISHGQKLTVWRFLAKLFCVLSGAHALMLLRDPLQTDQSFPHPKMKQTAKPGRKLIARGTGKHWILGGLGFSLIIIVILTRYGDQLPDLLQKGLGGARANITGPATAQPFDDQLSLWMPVPFGPVADYPRQKLPAATRDKVQKMTQRTAYFNGVYIVVMKTIINPGTKESVQDILFHAFSKSVSPPSSTMPKINSTEVNGVYQSGALRFPAVFGNRPGQMTVVVIQPGTEDAYWCINAWGREKAADLAEKTAREFTFK